jgi:DNA-binding MarR family transcriptional regulator
MRVSIQGEYMQTHKFLVHQMSSQKLLPIAILRRTLDHSQDDSRLVDAWRDLLDRHARTTSALERSLHEHGLGVSEYEVLERLATGEKDERRMQDLAEAVHLSQSALSRVVGRLEGDGLVIRTMCTEDRRGIFACLTDAGRERYVAARPAHRAVLAAALEP